MLFNETDKFKYSTIIAGSVKNKKRIKILKSQRRKKHVKLSIIHKLIMRYFTYLLNIIKFVIDSLLLLSKFIITIIKSIISPYISKMRIFISIILEIKQCMCAFNSRCYLFFYIYGLVLDLCSDIESYILLLILFILLRHQQLIMQYLRYLEPVSWPPHRSINVSLSYTRFSSSHRSINTRLSDTRYFKNLVLATQKAKNRSQMKRCIIFYIVFICVCSVFIVLFSMM